MLGVSPGFAGTPRPVRIQFPKGLGNASGLVNGIFSWCEDFSELVQSADPAPLTLDTSAVLLEKRRLRGYHAVRNRPHFRDACPTTP